MYTKTESDNEKAARRLTAFLPEKTQVKGTSYCKEKSPCQKLSNSMNENTYFIQEGDT